MHSVTTRVAVVLVGTCLSHVTHAADLRTDFGWAIPGVVALTFQPATTGWAAGDEQIYFVARFSDERRPALLTLAGFNSLFVGLSYKTLRSYPPPCALCLDQKPELKLRFGFDSDYFSVFAIASAIPQSEKVWRHPASNPIAAWSLGGGLQYKLNDYLTFSVEYEHQRFDCGSSCAAAAAISPYSADTIKVSLSIIDWLRKSTNPSDQKSPLQGLPPR